MKSFRRGFTLIETMVVLTVSALLLSLSLFMVQNFNFSHFQNYFFWRRFQNQFGLYEGLARRYQSSVTVTFSSRHRVNFTGKARKIQRSSIKEPSDLSTDKKYALTIGPDGRFNPQTVVWLINGRTRLYQKFQLSWGMYTIEDKK